MRVEELKFKFGAGPDQEPLQLRPSQVTIFVGPNNGGKSAALNEIVSLFRAQQPMSRIIFEDLHLAHIGEEELQTKFTRLRESGPDPLLGRHQSTFTWRAMRAEVSEQSVADAVRRANRGEVIDFWGWNNVVSGLLQFFALKLDGSNRLSLAGPGGAQPLQLRAQSTIAALFKDDALRSKLSNIVYEAFGMHLVIDPTSMGQFAYAMASQKPANPQIERSFGDDAIEYFKATRPIQEASDGTRAFVGIMAEVLAGDPEVLMIDEPEAFLHPGLAYALGREIGLNVGVSKQLFASTHSSHFLMGCLSSGVQMNIVRLTHRDGVGTARLLSADQLKLMMNDPMLRSVGVLTALFYQAAVVLEGDSDRAFYEEINNRLEFFDPPGMRHAILLNAHAKQAVGSIVEPLRRLGIPAASILDLDWIKEDGVVAQRYLSSSGVPQGLRSSLIDARRTVRSSLEEKSANYKRAGGLELLQGDERETAEAFLGQLEAYGLFTVRSGELESWLSSLQCRQDKSVWLSEMFSALGSDPNSAEYVKPDNTDVWVFLKRVAEWLSKSARRGMYS